MIQKNEKCKNNICFVIEGQYEFSDNNEQKLDFYGHESIVEKNDDLRYAFEMKFTTEGKLATTTKKEIENALGCSLEKAQQKSKEMKKIIEKHNDNRNERKNIAENMVLSDFHVVKKLG